MYTGNLFLAILFIQFFIGKVQGCKLKKLIINAICFFNYLTFYACFCIIYSFGVLLFQETLTWNHLAIDFLGSKHGLVVTHLPSVFVLLTLSLSS